MKQKIQITGMELNRFKRLLPLLALIAVACSDPFGPQFWNPAPWPVTMYSASRTEYVGLGSAVDFTQDPVSTISIEAPGATGNWDVVLVDQPGGGLALLSAQVLSGFTSRARIAVIEDRAFLDVREAPRDTAAYSVGPVALRTGVVYVIRTRRGSCGFTTGHRYAKMQPIEIDTARGIFRAVVVRNPFCDDRALVPPAD
ncbi:hypothetical protein BH23GEM9_BH23GEM9_02900 [soil metagenome]